MGPTHPCGGLPVTGWSASVWFCHHHQAFFAMRSTYSQTGEDDVTSHSTDSVEFGPFDSYTDVLNVVRMWEGAIKYLPDALNESPAP